MAHAPYDLEVEGSRAGHGNNNPLLDPSSHCLCPAASLRALSLALLLALPPQTATAPVSPQHCYCPAALLLPLPPLSTALPHCYCPCLPFTITQVPLLLPPPSPLLLSPPPQVREAQLDQYNYILVLGEQEKAQRTVNVRTRDNHVHGMHQLDEVVKTMLLEKNSRSLVGLFKSADGVGAAVADGAVADGAVAGALGAEE